ncbi:MAG: ABC transporter substrate-binding protein [Candidatus Rokuibacteriota bacterium]
MIRRLRRPVSIRYDQQVPRPLVPKSPFPLTPHGGFMTRFVCLVALVAAVLVAPLAAPAAPEGQLTWGVHITLAPTYFDPAETPGLVTPFMILYALHDALVKPMPGQPFAPSLAESWTASKDGLTYEFVLRKGVKFHNGEPVTAEDVKFSFERYRGSAATLLRSKVARVETPDARRVRLVLKQPWADFMTFYASPATGAAWIVPKAYVEKVGEDGFKKAPIGAGPYRFVSFKPGVELTLEANEGYWRKAPSVKTLLFRVITDESTRLAALKRGEVDIAYSFTGPLAEELKRTPGLTLAHVYPPFTAWAYPTEQWDPKSPWADARVRRAASLAIDRLAINQSQYLGLARMQSGIVPENQEYYWAAPKPVYDPKRAQQLLAEAGYPNGFDAGEVVGDTIYGTAMGEPVANFLQAIGIRTRLRTLERAAFTSAFGERKLRGLILATSGASGNAATRLETFAVSGSRFVYGTYPDIDGLFAEQVNEQNPRVRKQLLDRAQQLIDERVVFIPVMGSIFINGVGSRPEVHGLGLLSYYPYSAPYEDLKLKKK